MDYPNNNKSFFRRAAKPGIVGAVVGGASAFFASGGGFVTIMGVTMSSIMFSLAWAVIGLALMWGVIALRDAMVNNKSKAANTEAGTASQNQSSATPNVPPQVTIIS